MIIRKLFWVLLCAASPLAADKLRDAEQALANGDPARTATQRTNGDLLQLSLVGILNDADDIESTSTDVSGTIGYSVARPFLNTNWSFSATAGHTSFDEFSLSLDGRRDDYVVLGSTAVLTGMSYFGFSPSMTVTATKRRSNVDPFNSTQIQARFGMQSRF